MERLRPSDLILIVKELRRQRVLGEYKDQLSHWNLLAAVITNGLREVITFLSGKKSSQKPIEPKDYLSEQGRKLYEHLSKEDKPTDPQNKESKWGSHIHEAASKGIKIPWGGETG